MLSPIFVLTFFERNILIIRYMRLVTDVGDVMDIATCKLIRRIGNLHMTSVTNFYKWIVKIILVSYWLACHFQGTIWTGQKSLLYERAALKDESGRSASINLPNCTASAFIISLERWLTSGAAWIDHSNCIFVQNRWIHFQYFAVRIKMQY